MRHGVGVPSFRQHRYGDNTADAFPQLTGLAHGVHDFAQYGGFGKFAATLQLCRKSTASLPDFPFESGKLIFGGFRKAVVKRIVGFKLLGIYKQRSGACQGFTVFIEVTEQRQASVFQKLFSVLILSVETGNIVINQLGG